MTRILAIEGPGAELAAAARIRALRATGARVIAARVPSPADATLPAEACEFVTADGALLPSHAFWLEWATEATLTPTPACDTGADVLVLAAPGTLSGIDADERIATSPVRTDAFGRPECTAPRDGRECRIGVVGDAAHLRETNPAVLARLGDAAARTGQRVTALPLPPAMLLRDDLPTGLHGLVLPGGASMEVVEAQIAAAATALQRDLPVLGLCLGMQSMATALIRRAGWLGAALEEIAGPGPQRSFVRLHDANGAPCHRLGDRPFRPSADTALARLLPEGATLRMNHRFRLNPQAPLPDGAVLHAGGESDIADALECADHRFFVGLQGHPELGCDPALARLWDGFLAAADERAV